MKRQTSDGRLMPPTLHLITDGLYGSQPIGAGDPHASWHEMVKALGNIQTFHVWITDSRGRITHERRRIMGKTTHGISTITDSDRQMSDR